MEQNQKKILDRMQLLGLVGPLILLLTLFCTLLKGSMMSWYLFFSTLVGLPFCWQWRYKGLWASLGLVTLLFLIQYSFFPPHIRFWQFGAMLSLASGLFISFMGFEEVKSAVAQMSLESQSRLDNLIELDKKFNVAHETWKYDEAELQNELDRTTQLLKREKEDLLALEKVSSTIREELEILQNENSHLLSLMEAQAQNISTLEVETLKVQEKHHEIEQKLALNTSDREIHLQREFQHLRSRAKEKDEELVKLAEKLRDHERIETELALQVEKKEEAFKHMQEALRQKTSELQELEEKVLIREQTVNKYKEEVAELLLAVNQKEHEIFALKGGLSERDYQMQKLSQNLRDLQQDLIQSKARLEEKKGDYQHLELRLSEDVSRWENAYKTNEVQLKYLSDELLHLKEELQKREAHSTALLLEKKQIKFELEERKAHYEVLYSEKEALYDELKRKEDEFQKVQEQEEHAREKQFDELKKLNDARFALYQASLDKERLKNQSRPSENKEAASSPKHWLKVLEQLLKGEKTKNVDFSLLPKDLSNELLTLHQTKALYKQLRGQFDEKSEILEEARAQLYRAETEIAELTKVKEEVEEKGSEPERYLERELQEKQEELSCMQLEIEVLTHLMKEALSREGSEVKVG